ncbi:hypothetical protein ElyMa_006059800 [Elysia marginata]|uniref:Uncharacterized protein n=1 Tax=Elysia marginata TaxID=1093978 RepID=A0AAV4GNT0_9GAST|nr:hypothetical protein ElyMa_006059800 [Elysia marginata]
MQSTRLLLPHFGKGQTSKKKKHNKKQTKQNEDWFEAGIDLQDPAIAARGTALLEYKRQPSAKNLTIYRKARNNAKSISWKCASDYWLRLCGVIQSSANNENTKAISDLRSGGRGFDSRPCHVAIALGKQFTLTFPSPPTCKMGYWLKAVLEICGMLVFERPIGFPTVML